MPRQLELLARDEEARWKRVDKELNTQAEMLEKIVNRLTALEYYATASDTWGGDAVDQEEERNSGGNSCESGSE